MEIQICFWKKKRKISINHFSNFVGKTTGKFPKIKKFIKTKHFNLEKIHYFFRLEKEWNHGTVVTGIKFL